MVLLQLMTQMAYLNEWVVLESDHIDGLSGVVEDLEASTLRHPLIGGAKVCVVVFVSFWLNACKETLTSLLCLHIYSQILNIWSMLSIQLLMPYKQWDLLSTLLLSQVCYLFRSSSGLGWLTLIITLYLLFYRPTHLVSNFFSSIDCMFFLCLNRWRAWQNGRISF